jgi:hypothetical protein
VAGYPAIFLSVIRPNTGTGTEYKKRPDYPAGYVSGASLPKIIGTVPVPVAFKLRSLPFLGVQNSFVIGIWILIELTCWIRTEVNLDPQPGFRIHRTGTRYGTGLHKIKLIRIPVLTFRHMLFRIQIPDQNPNLKFPESVLKYRTGTRTGFLKTESKSH